MSDHKETTRREDRRDLLDPPVVEGKPGPDKPGPDKPGFTRVERQAQPSTKQVVNTKAAQDASASSFEVTIVTTDALAKTLMSSTPNVKMLNGGTKIDVFEVNPVHLVPGNYRVNLQTALVKTIAKDEALIFEY